MIPLLLLSVATLAAQHLPVPVDEALARPLLAIDQTRIDTQVYTAARVPVLQVPATRDAWGVCASPPPVIARARVT